MTNINFNIDFKIDCYSFEEINLEENKKIILAILEKANVLRDLDLKQN